MGKKQLKKQKSGFQKPKRRKPRGGGASGGSTSGAGGAMTGMRGAFRGLFGSRFLDILLWVGVIIAALVFFRRQCA